MRKEPNSSARANFSRTRVVLIGGIIPVVLAATATILMISWLPLLPNPIAVHWSGAGADGFGPAIPFIVTPAIITLLFSAFAVAWSWRLTATGQLGWNQKGVLVTGVWLATLLSIGFGSSIALQRGLADAHKASDAGPSLAAGAGIGLALAAVAWFLLPPGESIEEHGAPANPIDVRGEERISWSHAARFGNTALLIVALAVAVALGAVVFASVESTTIPVFGFVVVGLVSALVVTNTWWRVSADRRGFTVRSIAGWPMKRIPLAEIRTVEIIDVDPPRDFGGYGWRWSGKGRSGVVLRRGEGIEVTAASGKRFVVTVDDAATGAGVLAALLKQNSAH